MTHNRPKPDESEMKLGVELLRSGLGREAKELRDFVWQLYLGIYRIAKQRTWGCPNQEDLASDITDRVMRRFFATGYVSYDMNASFWKYIAGSVQLAKGDLLIREARRAQILRKPGNAAIRRNPFSDPSVEAEVREDRSAARLLVRKLMDRLPDHLRIALELREFQGYSARTVGKLLGVPAQTINNRVCQAKRKLAKWLTPDYFKDAA